MVEGWVRIVRATENFIRKHRGERNHDVNQLRSSSGNKCFAVDQLTEVAASSVEIINASSVA